MTTDKPYRPNVGIALFNAEGRVLIAHRFKDDGPEIVLPGLDWQMPQGGIDAEEDPRKAALRELWEETGIVGAEYLAETDWLSYEFPPYDGPPHRLSIFRGQRQKWFAMRFTGEDSQVDPLTEQRHAGGVRRLALGTPRPRRRPCGAVPARDLPHRRARICAIRGFLNARLRCRSKRSSSILARR